MDHSVCESGKRRSKKVKFSKQSASVVPNMDCEGGFEIHCLAKRTSKPRFLIERITGFSVSFIHLNRSGNCLIIPSVSVSANRIICSIFPAISMCSRNSSASLLDLTACYILAYSTHIMHRQAHRSVCNGKLIPRMDHIIVSKNTGTIQRDFVHQPLRV